MAIKHHGYGPNRRLIPHRAAMTPKPPTPKEEQKLDLEIEHLRKQNRKDIIRLVTTIVTVAGLLLGLYQYLNARQKERLAETSDRKLRFQSQMRADIDELLTLAHDESLTVSRASFLLQDLDSVMNVAATVDGNAEAVQKYRAAFTQSLVDLILYDSDFQAGPKSVRLAATVCERWRDYGKYLRDHPKELNLILYKHARAIRYLRDSFPSYLEHMRYFAETNQYFTTYEKKPNEEIRFQHFLHIRNSFKEHLRLTENDPTEDIKKIRAINLRDFEAALCNPEVAKQVLGSDFANEPCEK